MKTDENTVVTGFGNLDMDMPFQAAAVDREDLCAALKNSGVEPAFWGELLDKVKKAGREAAQTGINTLNNLHQ